jgi:putative peptidoglycan lipid II flippase
MMVGMLLSTVTEYGKEAAIAFRFGTTLQADAFFGAFIIPYTLFILFTYLGKMSIVPVITEVQSKESHERFNDLLGTLYLWVAIAGAGILIIGLAGSKYLIHISMPGTPREIWNQAVSLQRVLFLFTVLGAFVSLCLSIIQAQKHFVVPAFFMPFANTVVILLIFYGGKLYGLEALPWAYIGGMFLQFVILAITARHFNLRWFPLPRLHDGYLREISYLVLIPLLSFGIRSVNAISDRTLASFLETGSIAIINYSSKLIKGFSYISAGTIFTVSIPFLATLFLKNERKEVRILITRNIQILSLLLLPLTAIIISCPYEIISLLFQRGSFGIDATEKTSRALVFFSLGLYPGAMTFVLAAPFFAMKKPKIPMVNSLLMFLLNITLAIALMFPMGVNGIALAASLTYYISVVRMHTMLKKEIGRVVDGTTLKSTGRIALLSLCMMIVMCGLKSTGIGSAFPPNLIGKIALLSLIAGSGVASFLLTTKIIRIPEIGQIASTLQSYFVPARKKNNFHPVIQDEPESPGGSFERSEKNEEIDPVVKNRQKKK